MESDVEVVTVPHSSKYMERLRARNARDSDEPVDEGSNKRLLSMIMSVYYRDHKE